jgi:hypothetical protein
MLTVIKGFFTGPNGEGSSKRVMGIACIVSGIVKAFLSADVAMVSLLLGTGTALLTASAITKT